MERLLSRLLMPIHLRGPLIEETTESGVVDCCLIFMFRCSCITISPRFIFHQSQSAKANNRDATMDLVRTVSTSADSSSGSPLNNNSSKNESDNSRNEMNNTATSHETQTNAVIAPESLPLSSASNTVEQDDSDDPTSKFLRSQRYKTTMMTMK